MSAPETAPMDGKLLLKHTAAELRLRKHADFQRVYNATKKQHARQMSFFAAVRAVVEGEYAGPRVGLTVGRVMGKAHERNRMKRRLREAIRAEQASLGGMPVDVILHPRRSVETVPYEQLCADVRQVFATVRKRSRSAVPLQAAQREPGSTDLKARAEELKASAESVAEETRPQKAASAPGQV